MNRADALKKMKKYEPTAALFGLLLKDEDDSTSAAVDAALRDLGYGESELADAEVEAANVPAYLALLEYHLLNLLASLAIGAIDSKLDSGRTAISASQLYNHLVSERDQAKKRAQAFGYGVGGSDFVLGEINFDYLEPETTGV